MSVQIPRSIKRARCEHCGAHVSTDFRRVYGDDDDRAHRCPECDTFRRLSEGSGAGLEVTCVDPEHSPGRHGTEAGRWSA